MAKSPRTSRYSHVRRLGVGSFGEAFLADDRETGRRVVIKISATGDAESRRDLAEEFARVAPLAHPGIARALDFGLDDEGSHAFIVFEALTGTPSSRAAAGAAAGAKLSWAAGVAETLDFLHHSGLLHGDLKPEHVFIDDDGVPGLIDFGLARREGEPAGGTATTVAPEILLVGQGDLRSDLFSFGATLYAWLYGRYPFGESLDERLAALSREPETPELDGLSDEAVSLLRELLAANPEERPASAREVATRLAGLGVPLPDPSLAEPAARARSVPLIGRDRNLHDLAPAWSTGDQGACFVMLSGPPRSGRSRLLELAARKARLAHRAVFEVSGGGRTSAGVVLLSSLARRRGDRAPLGRAGLSLAVRAIADAGPATILVDDASLLAPDDLEELIGLPGRFTDDEPITVVAVTEKPASPAGWTMSPLAPLGHAQVSALLSALLPGPPPPHGLPPRLGEASGGRPGPVVDAVLRAVRRGVVECSPAGWSLAALAQQPLAELTSGATPPAGEIVDTLSESARELIGALYAAGRPVRMTDVREMTGLSHGRVADSFRELLDRGLVSGADDGGFAITTEMGHAPELSSLASPAHEKWLAWLRSRPPAAHAHARAWWLGRMARHASHAGATALGARLAHRAVDRALGAGRPDIATAVLAELPPRESFKDADRAFLVASAGEIHLATGRSVLASRELESARDLMESSGRREAALVAQIRLARGLGDLGRLEEALGTLDDAERRARTRAAEGRAALERGVLFVRSGDRHGAIESFDRAVRRSPPGSQLLARARVARARCLVLVGRSEEALQELALARDAKGSEGLIASIDMTEVQACIAGGRFRDVLDKLAPTRARLLRRGDLDGLGMLHAIAADAAASLSDLTQALDLARESLRWRRLQPHPRWLAPGYVRLARVHLVRGEMDAARAALQRARVTEADATDAGAQVASRSVRSRISLIDGNPSSALRHAQSAVTRARQGADPAHLAEALTCVAAARLALDDAGGALSAAREALDICRRGGLVSSVEAEALALYGEAHIDREVDRAVRLARRARVLADRCGDFDAGTRALLVLERALVRRGEAVEADRVRRWVVARIEEAAARGAEATARTAFLDRPDRAKVLERSGPRDSIRLRSIYEIVSELNSLRDPRLVVERLMDRALSTLGADRGAIVLSADGGELEVALSRGVEPETEKGALSLSKTILDRARGGEAILTANPASDVRFSGVASVRMFDISAVLCVPLRWRDDVVGAIYVDSRLPQHRFDKKDLAFVEALADHAALALANARAFDGLLTENARLRADLGRRDGLGPLVGRSLAMEKVFQRIEAAAPSGRPVLILGESGTGKELVARTIHRLGPHPDGPFVDVNCAGVPESILEATLFGYEKGAFTDAVRSHEGLIEQAAGGTLFLDEIGDMPLPMQSTLLRVLQQGELRRLGATESREIEFRLVTATHRPVDRLVADGEFREDLLYRIDVLRIAIPPLRERLEDLPLLVRHVLERLGDDRGHLELEPELLEKLAVWSWPGNVRELENVLTRLAIHAPSGRIGMHALAADPELSAKLGAPLATSSAGMRQVERDAIRRALLITNGNRERAARLLGIGRATIFRKIRLYSLENVGKEPRRRRRSV